MTLSTTRTTRVIRATPEELYGAFLDPAALVAWLPPAGMTGRMHTCDARVGGGYEMSLYYPPDERSFRGKTSEREDRVAVRFVGNHTTEALHDAGADRVVECLTELTAADVRQLVLAG